MCREVLVAVIGPRWLTATDEDGQRPPRSGRSDAWELERSPAAAGFSLLVERVVGDWGRRPVEPDSPELIVVAARR
jgi:hypothetical protein